MADKRDRPLERSDLDSEPLRTFERWFEEARAVVRVPEATALATAGSDGAPSARMVLLKRFDERGFVFHTHYASRKGRELETGGRAALLLYWEPLGRQVRIEGRAERTAAEESDAYFATRPLDAQIGAHASRQSEAIGSRDELEQRVAELERELSGGAVERPEGWGGFRIVPDAWEFWQHRENRLHDRFRYRPHRGGWVIDRLSP